MNTDQDTYGAIVIGGGIAGLTAASYLGRAGYRTLLLERSARLGGRAVTREVEGFHLNVGPHALYLAGEGCAVLRDLGVSYAGGPPVDCGRWILDGAAAHRMPGTPWEILNAGFLSLPERLEVLRVMARLSAYGRDPQWERRPLRDWLESKVRRLGSRRFLQMFIRLATYSGDLDQNASAALRQLGIALQGVSYLNHGWQTLVDGLAACAFRHEVALETSAGVAHVTSDGVTATVRLTDGRTFETGVVVLATGPQFAAKAVNNHGSPTLIDWAARARPVYAACLDVALSRLPNPDANFMLGLSEPYYLSVHSQSARLAPAGGAVIHVARYLGANDPSDIEAELEAILDRFQSGWRECLVTRRYLPRMVVTEAGVSASDGLAGRAGPRVPEWPNVFVAGDWVGPQGMLVDASFASARLAAELAKTHLESSLLVKAA